MMPLRRPRRFAALAAAALSLAAVAWLAIDRPDRFRLESEEGDADGGKSPAEGDFWAVRLGYYGHPNELRFDPQWLVEAARENAKIASGIPAGEKRYVKSAEAGFALDPNAFTLLGPKPLRGQVFGADSAAGRTHAILTDPDNPGTAWIGADGGGVWKTTNCCSAATTWTVKTDFPQLASMAIGTLAMDPNNHNVIYAGTGDLRYGSFSFGAAGLLKSTDRGETWQLLGANVFTPRYTPVNGSAFSQYQAIGKVVVDPNDSNRIVVGAKTGLYFSYDAGVNWAGPCFTNAFTSGATAQRQDITGLLALDRSGTTQLYAAVGTRGRATPVQPDLDRNGANGIYRIAMPSSGCPAVGDWSLLANGFPAGTGNGLANGSRGRLELAVAPSNTQVLYAMFTDISNWGILGIWKSTNGGDAWTQIGKPANPGTQMWYDASLAVSPTDPAMLFVSTVDLFRTGDGINYVNLTDSYSNGPVHPDNHASAFVGGDAAKLLNGNDGGVYFLSNANTASSSGNANWIALNDTYPTLETYHGDITANFATDANPGVSAGFQDNGSATAVFTGTPVAGSWNSTNSGDGIVSRIEPILRQRWYYSSQNGNVVVSTNGPDGAESSASGPWNSDVRSFVFPYDIYRYGDTAVANSGCTAAQGCTRLIAGSQRLWETTTGGIGAASWIAKTGDLTKNNLLIGADNRSFINNLHYAVSDPTIAIVGTMDGNVQVVFGLGGAGVATAVNVTGNNAVLPNRPIMDVATHPTNPLIGYAAVGGFGANTPATPGHVYRVSCTANCASFTWADKSGNLPDIPANTVIVNPHFPAQVFVGMDWGLYYTNDIDAATPTWQRFEGLPHVMVWSLTIDRGFTTLAAYTRGRGVWAWPLPTAPTGASADLAVAITPPVEVKPGMETRYTVSVTNQGPNPATAVQLVHTPPTGLAIKSVSGDCLGPFPCAFPTLASGQTRSVTVTACVARSYVTPDPMSFTASVSAATSDPQSANNAANASAALMLSVFADGFDCP